VGAARSKDRSDAPDWRRENINQFVAALHRGIKRTKPEVKFGISPFGIWRPRNPATIEADLDAYAQLFADSAQDARRRWCDYFAAALLGHRAREQSSGAARVVAGAQPRRADLAGPRDERIALADAAEKFEIELTRPRWRHSGPLALEREPHANQGGIADLEAGRCERRRRSDTAPTSIACDR
jgi:hypothetical protein